MLETTVSRHNLTERLLAGAVAGLAGTVALQGVRTLDQTLMPYSQPRIKEEPGDFMTELAQSALSGPARRQIPDAAKKASASSLAFGYGATAGLLYAAGRPDGGGPIVWDGVALGVATWA